MWFEIYREMRNGRAGGASGQAAQSKNRAIVAIARVCTDRRPAPHLRARAMLII
jgi:hypothetical protein